MSLHRNANLIFSKATLRVVHQNFLQQRAVSLSSVQLWQNYENSRNFEPGEDVLNRVKVVFESQKWKREFRRNARRYREAKYDAFQRKNPIAHVKRRVLDYELLPFRAEFVIIGGGLSGSSTAFWLKQIFRDEDMTVVVIESPEHFARSRSMLGSGIISQQFSVPEFVEMSLYSAEFIRHAGEHLKILDNDPPDINLFPVNFLHLATTQEQADSMKSSWKMQIEKGARVGFYTVDELNAKFPFMNFDDVVAGTCGLENEGVFDSWQLLSALREKNITLGVRYVKAEVEGIVHESMLANMDTHGSVPIVDQGDYITKLKERIVAVLVRPQMTGSSARPIRFFRLVNAAGPWSGEIAKMAGIGLGDGLLSVPLPIVCKRRTHYVIHAPEVPTLQMPALVDPSGVFCRPDGVGYNYICGKHPTKKDILQAKNEMTDEVDYDFFYREVWPTLVKRVPSFKNAKVINAWNMYEDANTFDNVPVLGENLFHANFYQMCGLGGYGSQLSVACGRLYMEKELELAYMTTNVRKFDMRRIMQGKRYEEPFRCS